MPETSTQSTDFEELMAELATGSEDAAWKIADIYSPHIIRVVRSKLPKSIRSKVDSQDFVQAVWASLLLRRTYLAKMKTPEQLVGLLAAVARNKVVDECRQLSAQARDVRRETSMAELEVAEKEMQLRKPGIPVQSALASRDPTPSMVVSVRERWRQTMESCSVRDRRIVALRIQGLTYQEISEKLVVGNATVRRVLGRLIGQMGE